MNEEKVFYTKYECLMCPQHFEVADNAVGNSVFHCPSCRAMYKVWYGKEWEQVLAINMPNGLFMPFTNQVIEITQERDGKRVRQDVKRYMHQLERKLKCKNLSKQAQTQQKIDEGDNIKYLAIGFLVLAIGFLVGMLVLFCIAGQSTSHNTTASSSEMVTWKNQGGFMSGDNGMVIHNDGSIGYPNSVERAIMRSSREVDRSMRNLGF